MSRILSPTEAMALLDAGRDYLSRFCCGFAKISTRDGVQSAVIGGAGTLVQASGRYAILTADHVVTNLPDREDVGLILTMDSQITPQRFMLPMQHVTKIRLAVASLTKDGPDLGLLLLPDALAQRIQVYCTFYNLEKRRDVVLSSPIVSAAGNWVVAGMVHERSFALPDERDMGIQGFAGMVGGGVVNNERTVGKFDYVNFETRTAGAYDGPDSFEGMSGGGLWRLLASEENGIIVVNDALLCGVVFYQQCVLGGKDLICHARHSVYEHALSAL